MFCSLSTEQSIRNGRELKNVPVVSDHYIHALRYFLLGFYCITSTFQVRKGRYFLLYRLNIIFINCCLRPEAH